MKQRQQLFGILIELHFKSQPDLWDYFGYAIKNCSDVNILIAYTILIDAEGRDEPQSDEGTCMSVEIEMMQFSHMLQ